MKPSPIILASASPRRSLLLKKAKIPFKVHAPEVHEKSQRSHPKWTPRQLAIHNAELKARIVARKFPTSWVLGADTIVVLGKTIFGKPVDMQEAQAMLKRLNGRTHRVITGICLCKKGKRKILFSETTHVTFHYWSDRKMQNYLKRIHPLDKAGSYAAQAKGNTIIRLVRGSFNNVVGLPVEKLLKRLETVL